MKIVKLETMRVSVPLQKPFRTSIRYVKTLKTIYLKVTCNNGIIGWGEAVPIPVITGESLKSIETVIHEIYKPLFIGENIWNYEKIFQQLNGIVVGNYSAKAAVDMALYDCMAQYCKLPLFRFFGGWKKELETDMTVSVNDPQKMGKEAFRFLQKGFSTLKVKVGSDSIDKDLERIKEIRRRVGKKVSLRVDANQAWTPKEAIRIIRTMEDEDMQIELVEQPVKAHDLTGLKQVTEAVSTPILADESIYSAHDALEIVRTRSADMINIKLMKSGGIYHAHKICAIAESSGMECMIGCMLETHLGVTAAAHFAASKKNITKIDLDAPFMLGKKPVIGGGEFKGSKIILPETPGLGIQRVIEDLHEKRGYEND